MIAPQSAAEAAIAAVVDPALHGQLRLVLTLLDSRVGCLIIGVLNNALTLFAISNEILTIVTGMLLLSSVLVPNLINRWRQAQSRRAALQALASSSTPPIHS